MRFFADDLSIVSDVDWSFCEPGAKKLTVDNIFNSRNWYLGRQDWPQLGEVLGASRLWRDGSPTCDGQAGEVIGPPLGWVEGAEVADGLPSAPCNCLCQGWDGVQPTFLGTPAPLFGMSLDTLTGYRFRQAGILPDVWWVLKPGAPPCGLEPFRCRLVLANDQHGKSVIANLRLTDPPPDIGQAGTWVVPDFSPRLAGQQVGLLTS
jgi:hypothetical protein